ncbi:uncharacterized protein PHACADRAFT_263837 [Phanerochaete carnosa HHB-10118-sp]|uniref:Smr domain-containing protein n=1 Tax=Phanerochaete carnosa (strain HHB-10118-sp) TaxID=650164 RepID=K5WJS7_PHACS|nr:uncharacterized protein PHACADRAFT_263837 [Phanerochaete carnosa HHB-10118-sp]EKM50507.1 hypothetical protein PHACADRAFT_263837 [Phanerochaete carnosa HHB-10118-sp]
MPLQSIQDVLQSEFSPPLDTSLIAAIVADYVSETPGEPSPAQLRSLRQTLSELAVQAEQECDESPVSDDFAQLQLSNTDDNTSTADLFSAGSSINTANTSNVSGSSAQSFSSPLGFLQTAFPHLPVSRLKSVLGSAQEEDEIDMESIVEDILSSEFVKDLEERGLEDEVVPETDWQTAQPSKKKKKQNKWKGGKTLTLVDVRQRQHIPISAAPRASGPDPWTQLSSVATHLETLLPSRSASYFQSLFHSPEYASPSDALRSVLLSMSASSFTSELELEVTTPLFVMFDVICDSPEYASLDDIDQRRMLDDAQLALRATEGNADAAFDIVKLLRELDGGDVDWAVYHSPAPASPILSSNGSNMKSKHATRPPTMPPAAQPPRVKTRPTITPLAPKPPPNVWKTVPVIPKRGPNPHANFIPAYQADKSSPRALGKKQTNEHRSRANELLEQRREALRDASRAWQRGNTGNRGGEVALYFAERARTLQEEARKENLNAAWDLVESGRISKENGCSIDLHGTTVAEAIQIVKDVLREDPPSPARPLKIITGRGKHSTNGVGVLGPAVNNALFEEGWNVAKWDAGLIIRGRTSRWA